jgi:hypothetical protein
MQPLVPGFVVTGEASVAATVSQWAAVRVVDGLRCTIRILPVADLRTEALATRQLALRERIENTHLVRQHAVVPLTDGTLALVVEEVDGVSLAQLVGARGQLTTGETVTTVAPLFGALADLHAAGVLHGDLAPGSIRFTADGRPLICDVDVAGLLTAVRTTTQRGMAGPATWGAGGRDGASSGGFVAPEVIDGGVPSSCSDVYAMAAVGWFCLTGVPPGPGAARPLLRTLCPEVPPRLVEILKACLDADPAERPSADAAAADVFDAAPAESVALIPISDPAAEITRRIRAAAVSASANASRVSAKRHQSRLTVGAVMLGVLVALGAGATWFTLGPAARQQAVAGSKSQSQGSLSAAATPRPALPFGLSGPLTGVAPMGIAGMGIAPTGTRSSGIWPSVLMPSGTPPRDVIQKREEQSSPTTTVPGREPLPATTEVMTAPGAPRLAPTRLLQALVDARALAYLARSAPLLDLVYAAGAPKAAVDRANIATALKNGGTYLGLSFVVRDVVFVTGTPDTARIQAAIVTPAYRTGQQDGRKILHPPETLGPCIFTVRLTPDGWRLLALSSPTSAR